MCTAGWTPVKYQSEEVFSLDIQEMQEPTSLKQLIQEMTPEAMEIIQGRVVSASPLKIQAINDDKLILTENIICLPRHLSTYKTTVDISLGSGAINSVTGSDNGHTHSLVTYAITGASMTVYNGLKAGDTVYILSFNHRKKYYILDREA